MKNLKLALFLLYLVVGGILLYGMFQSLGQAFQHQFGELVIPASVNNISSMVRLVINFLTTVVVGGFLLSIVYSAYGLMNPETAIAAVLVTCYTGVASFKPSFLLPWLVTTK